VPLLLESNEGVGPADQTIPGAKAGKQLLLAAQHRVVGGLGYCLEQVILVGKVVVELAARRRRPGPDVVQAGRPGPLGSTVSRSPLPVGRQRAEDTRP
jgi:hypothetical protein